MVASSRRRNSLGGLAISCRRLTSSSPGIVRAHRWFFARYILAEAARGDEGPSDLGTACQRKPEHSRPGNKLGPKRQFQLVRRTSLCGLHAAGTTKSALRTPLL